MWTEVGDDVTQHRQKKKADIKGQDEAGATGNPLRNTSADLIKAIGSATHDRKLERIETGQPGIRRLSPPSIGKETPMNAPPYDVEDETSTSKLSFDMVEERHGG